MESDSKDIDRILANLLTDYLLGGHQNKTNDTNVCKTEPVEPTASNVTSNSTINNQQYCFIIFNNRRWSQLLKKKHSNISQQVIILLKSI